MTQAPVAPGRPGLRTSVSAVQAYRRCQQRYYYSYVRRLRQRVKDVAPQRGIIIHEYLAEYYGWLSYPGGRAESAHEAALERTIRKHGPALAAASQAAFMFGDEKVSQEYHDMLDVVTRLMNRYYLVRGRGDAERYTPILVEEWITAPITDTIESASAIDLVLRENDTGNLWLVEHKSTGNVPPPSVRLRDLQTMVYTSKLDMMRNMHIYGALWNYISTKEPSVPDLLKTKPFGLTHRKDIDTTWEVYSKAIADNGLNEADYQDMRERLLGREHSRFFPRYEHMLVADPGIVLRDYVQDSRDMQQAEIDWEAGKRAPVRNLSRDCDFCPFYKLCEAVVMGGDDTDLIRMNFTVGKTPPRTAAPEIVEEPWSL